MLLLCFLRKQKLRFLLNYLNALVISAVLANLVRSDQLAAV